VTRPSDSFGCPSAVRIALLVIAAVIGISITAAAQTEAAPADSVIADTTAVRVAPPTSVVAEDHKYDAGGEVDLSWVPSISESLQNSPVLGYRIYRSVNGNPEILLDELLPGEAEYEDKDVVKDSVYSYRVATIATDRSEYLSITTQPLQPQVENIDFNKSYLFLIALVISGAVIYFVETAKRGKKLFVRRIAGLEAIDDAVGRATEMGRPVLFIPGINDMDDVQTLAALTILGRVAHTIADFDSKIFMPVSRSLVMTAARETIKNAYQTAGRPDAYSDDMVSYVTDEQFGYVAAVDGVMVRERPATVFLLGAFFAESLILAETGNSVGAIQIAGTARPAQLPFFIAACDFTLIGEELFAASAYLSGEPRQLGSLKGQDVGKFIAMVVILVGVLSVTLAEAYQIGLFEGIFNWLSRIFSSN